ncbi:putative ribonuclease H-like domain-containing protein [Tanacetum coccineum]
MHVAFDKRKVECFNCHNTRHFARECKFKGSKEGSRQEAGRGQDFKPVRTEKEALMTIDEGQINWVEQTTDEELNHALMAFTVNNEVSMCSKLCLDSYNALQAKYDELQSEFGSLKSTLYSRFKQIITEAYGDRGSKDIISGKICDKKLNVLFTEKECFVVSSDFKMPDENQALLKVPRQHNMYTFDMKNVDSSKGYTCLLAKASSIGAKLWHRRLWRLQDLMVFLLPSPLKEATRKASCFLQRVLQETPSKAATFTNIQEVNTGYTEDISPSADHEEEVFSDADDDEMPEIRIYDLKISEDEVDVPTYPLFVFTMSVIKSKILGDPNTPVQTRSSLKKINEAPALTKSQKPLKMKVVGSYARNKKDERGVVVRNKARLVAQGHRQEEGIDYDEVFAPMARLEAIRLFLAFASYMGFIVYQMDVKSAFLYGTIEEEVYVSQPPGFVDPGSPQRVYKSSQSQRDLHISRTCKLLSLKKFDDESGEVTPKVSHLYAVKRIFKYIKGKPKLGLWYPRESPLDLVAYSDSDYAAANLDRKSTTGGCQFLGRRLISWQCKKQTIVATSTTEAEYVAAASCCGQVLWLQNQLLDYGFNFMNTIIHIDNQSTICIIKNPVYHSKTKHIEIRHHFIRDCYEKKLIQVQKIHTDLNVADLLTKPFDGPRYYMEFERMLQAQLGHEKGHASCHLPIGCKLVVSYSNMLESAGYTEIVDFTRCSKLIEGPSFDPSSHMSPPPSHELEIQTSRTSEERFQGSQAPPGSKIYRRKPKSTTTLTKVKLILVVTPLDQVYCGVILMNFNTGETESSPKGEKEKAPRLKKDPSSRSSSIKENKRARASRARDQILAEKIQQEEREQYSIEERAKFLHDTIAAQRKFLAEQRLAAIRNKPPTISQLRNQMITYLKHVANKKHA